MYKCLSVIVLILIVLNSCTLKKSISNMYSIKSNPEIEVINIDSAEFCEKLYYSSYFDAPIVIALETSDACIIRNIQSIDYYDNRLFILDDESNALYVFADDGSFIQRIGHRGNGHGEYVEISDFSIDRKNNELYLWDEALDMAHKYNIDTGHYISSIKTERNGARSFCMQYCNGHLYVNKTSIDDSKDQYLLKEIDVETGLQTASYLDAEHYNKGWNYPLRLPHSFFYARNSASPKYIELFSDTIISITEEGLIPSYVIKSRDILTNEDICQFKKNQANPLDFNMEVLKKKGRVSQISQYADFKEDVYLEFHKGADCFYLIYKKKNKKAVYSPSFVNDYISKELNVPMNVCYSDDFGILAYIMPMHMPYFFEHFVKPKILNVDNTRYEALIHLKDDSNPVFFYHKFHE